MASTTWIPPVVQPKKKQIDPYNFNYNVNPQQMNPGVGVPQQNVVTPPIATGTTPQTVTTPGTTPQTVTTPGLQKPPTVYDPLWSNTNPGIAKGFTDTLNQSLSGQIYDPFVAGQQQALATAEANKRAGTAAQVASAGFAGTGIGQQAGGATEDQLLSNRFNTNIGIEQAKNQSRLAALGMAQNYAQANQSSAGLLKQNFAAYVTNHPELLKGVNEQTVFNDPTLKTQAQNLWQAQGGQGEVPAKWASDQINAVNQSGNATIMAHKAIDYEIQNGVYTPQEGEVVKSLLSNKAVLAAYKKDPKTGQLIPDVSALEKALGLPSGSLGGTPSGQTPGGYTAPDGTVINKPSGAVNNQPFMQGGNLYKVNDEGKVQPVDVSDLSWNDMKKAKNDPATQKAVLDNLDTMTYDELWKKFDSLVESKQLLKIIDPTTGKEVLARAVTTAPGVENFETIEGKSINIKAGNSKVSIFSTDLSKK